MDGWGPEQTLPKAVKTKQKKKTGYMERQTKTTEIRTKGYEFYM